MAGLDCWGLVLLVRSDFGKEPLPSYEDIDPLDKKSLTIACVTTIRHYVKESDSKTEGAIAAAWQGKVCVHVGVVVYLDGRLWVMETDLGKNICLTPVNVFEARYTRVEYYD